MKKNMVFILFCLVLTVLTVGCSSTSGGTKYNYPSDLSEMCKAERQGAKSCIEGKGYKLKEKADALTLVKHKGEKDFGSQGWGWRSPEWDGMWVLGLCYDRGGGRYEIHVGVHPKTGGGAKNSTVKHEHGHFWLMSNYRMNGHDSVFSSCFVNWNDPRFKSMMVLTRGGEIVIVDYITDEDAKSLDAYQNRWPD